MSELLNKMTRPNDMNMQLTLIPVHSMWCRLHEVGRAQLQHRVRGGPVVAHGSPCYIQAKYIYGQRSWPRM